ncbi:MAG: hypothetical protein ACHQ17_12740, partial [Polyangia bacterium]
MKSVFNFISRPLAIGPALAIALGLGLALPAVARAQTATPLDRMASLVDYVAADYPGAVKNGKVLVASEWAEQEGM